MMITVRETHPTKASFSQPYLSPKFLQVGVYLKNLFVPFDHHDLPATLVGINSDLRITLQFICSIWVN